LYHSKIVVKDSKRTHGAFSFLVTTHYTWSGAFELNEENVNKIFFSVFCGSISVVDRLTHPKCREVKNYEFESKPL
jgi:hypothetical protein